MTAIIATLNKHGVAIASDSAATISNGIIGKVYNTANKLFALSKIHPLGIMICGNAEFMGIPWDIIIKGYRKQLKDRSFDTLQDYADDLISYLKSGAVPFSVRKSQLSEVIHFFNSEVSSFMRSMLPPNLPPNINIKIPIEQIKKRMEDQINRDELGESVCDSLFAHFQELIATNNPLFSTRDQGLLAIRTLIEKYVFKQYLRKHMSELVIVGYGETELFPSLQNVSFFSSIGVDWEVHKWPVRKITEDVTGMICPFAQRDDMVTMIEGVHPILGEYMVKNVMNTLIDFKRDIISQVQDSKVKQQIKIIDESRYVADFEKKFVMLKQRVYISPLMSNIGLLEKEDLAKLAENMIAITSLRKKISMEQESVGGPIDLAVISKYDGFIWLKRKYYFDKELNPQFFANYYRDV